MPEHARVYETQVKDYQVGVITDSTHVLTGEVGLETAAAACIPDRQILFRFLKIH